MKGKKIALFVTVIYLVVLVLCSSTIFWQGSVPALFAKLTKTVSFEEGIYKTDSTDIAVKLHPGETELLSKFTQLKTADFRGSENLEEIVGWSNANPQVAVVYDVPLPDGSYAVNSVSQLDFTGITNSNFSEHESVLKYLPYVAQIDLGSAQGAADRLSLEQLKYLMDSYPQITFSYQMELMGKAVSIYDESLDLSGLPADQLEQALGSLMFMRNLKTVELGTQATTALSWENIKTLTDARPDVTFNYSFDLYGKSFTLADEIIDLSYHEVGDEGEAVRAALRCMKQCKTLDMDFCGLSDEKMAEIRAEFTDVDVIWRIWFGQLYSVRTDVERILASKPSVGGVLDNNEVAKLRYCTKVKYLDLGHNEAISDLSFVSHMPDLEVFIIAMNPVMDISPLANCPKLEYLELNSTGVGDLSPLANAKALRHLNISNCYMTDISPLFGLTELERLWIGNQTPIPVEQVQQMQYCAPNCKISTVSDDPHGDYWRVYSYDINTGIYVWAPRYELLRKQIGYDYQEYSFYWLDMKCNLPAPPEYAGTYYIHEDQLNGEAEKYGLT